MVAVKDHDYRDYDQGGLPTTIRRHVTDFGCCILFLVALVALAMVTQFAMLNGKPANLARLPTEAGEFCGLSANVKNKSLLYFCGAASGNISYANAICVSSCTEEACPGFVRGGEVQITSRPFAGMFCLPDALNNRLKATRILSIVTHNKNVRYLLQAKGLSDAWPLLLAAACCSAVFGFLFLHCLEKFTGCLVWVGFCGIIGLLGSFGGYFFVVGQQVGGADGLPGTGDKQYDLILGYVGIGLTVVMVFGSCCLCRSIQKAICCIESAAECIAETPGLLLEPFLALTLRGVILAGLLVGFVNLLTCEERFIPESYGLNATYKQDAFALLGFYAFMILWIMEICTAMSTFVVSYIVQLWFLDHQRNKEDRHSSHFVMTRAYMTGLMYHIGTLAHGSLAIAALRLVRIFLSMFTSSSASAGNAVATTSGLCCSCVADLFDRVLQKLNKFAFMDVAVNSNNFCTAAGHALAVLTWDATSAMTLHGCTRVFEIAGVGSITLVGAAASYLLATKLPQYGDPTSETYVSDPVSLCIFAGFICFFIALPFMLCFSTAADTILFCFALEKSRLPTEIEEERQGFVKFCFCNSSKKLVKLKYDDSRHPSRTRTLIKAMDRR